MKLPKHYDSKESEPKWQQYWIKEKIFAFDPDSSKKIFSIDTPPPTVSGKMHIGHAFMYSQMDFIARFKRMQGFNLFYPFGTDDNGLATERLIEKMKGVKGSRMDRSEFAKLCIDTLDKELRPEYLADWKRIGISCDWNIFYTTIDEHSQKISQRMFLDLVKKKRVERKFSPITFCPQCQTAIAQVEMEDVEKKTELVYVKGKVESGEFIIYATTRPELHPSCVGVSIDAEGDYVTVELKDKERWIISEDAVETMKEEFGFKVLETYKGKKIVGKKVDIAFAEKPVAISHDESAKTEYGTGVVYYCTYGGLDCVEWMARHTDVEAINIMDFTGTYSLGPYKGMKSEEARKEVIIDLEQQNLLIKKESMGHTANVHERCGTPIEYVATEQWFIRYLDLKKDFLKRGNELKWYPAHMKNRFDNWVKGLQWDWCISRQRFSGVPFPVWYDKEGNPVYADEKDLPVDPLKDLPKGYKKGEVTPEKDVMDTWATSSLTPQLAAELFKDKPVYKKLLPMDLRPQAHDIITFWLFNTVVRSHLHDDRLPWKDVMISGWALDPRGKKMSKSKGNVVEPQKVIEQYSADSLRFWSAASKLGDDLAYQEKDLVTGEKFITKLWNASKFALMHLEDYKGKKPKNLESVDAWILSKMSSIIKSATASFEKYEYSKARAELDVFFWHDFCDQYLEMVKDRLYNPDVRGKAERESAQYALYETLLAVLKVMAPIMPHITEEIYHLFFASREKCKSIHISSWPTLDMVDAKSDALGALAVFAVTQARKAKTEKNLSLKEPIVSLALKGTVSKKDFETIRDDIVAATKAEEVVYEQLDSKSEIDFEADVRI
jgi:valyl-tRNA synthetase